ncbi:MAG TPA: hypothetical protein PKW08_09935, partial [Flavobacteriaceae bacterium]|nr:hypothetical protein [Flavobacteriaceae bacterium]
EVTLHKKLPPPRGEVSEGRRGTRNSQHTTNPFFPYFYIYGNIGGKSSAVRYATASGTAP